LEFEMAKAPKTKSTDVPEAGSSDSSEGVTLIPLSQLQRKPSKINVRTVEPTGIEALADNIAAVGLLQNLIAVPYAKGRFEVVAGGRRLRALQLLVKRRKLPVDHPVPCQIRQADSAILASLSENVQREAMHPADEFDAFARLVGTGKAIEDVAASFGVTPVVVQRRLKLAAVSPRLMTDFRAGALSLEQMMALTLSDDHAAQEAAFYNVPEWARTASHIRQRLVGGDVRATDRRARFVGLDAYQAAGGVIREDLFADADRAPAYLSDSALLDRIVDERLQNVAVQVQAEGWQWVQVTHSLSYSETQSMRRVSHERVAPTAEQAARFASLEEAIDARQLELSEAEEAEDDERYGQAEEAISELQNELERLRDSLRVFPAFARTVAGAFVSLDGDGVIEIDRGWVRREDVSKLNALVADRAKRPEPDHDDSGEGDNDGDNCDNDDGAPVREDAESDDNEAAPACPPPSRET
jgi:ParB family chromosome partitioning protein